MSYDCKSEASQCDNVAQVSCTRVQQFSNTVSDYSGAPIGNSECDCASHININLAKVANYFPARTEEELESLRVGEAARTVSPEVEGCVETYKRCNKDEMCCSKKCKFRQCQ